MPSSPVLWLTATGCSPGRASGQIQTSAEAALQACAAQQSVILVATEITPADQHVLEQVAGVITARGGFSSHAAIVARSLGIPAVCGASSVLASGGPVAGTTVTIDGDTGEVWLGEQGEMDATGPVAQAGPAVQSAAGAMQIFANADGASQVEKARELGAVGIGLCRIEHIVNSPQLLRLVQDLVTADVSVEALAVAEPENSKTVATFTQALSAELASLLAAAEGLPVTVRLLDAPLYEIAPNQAGAERNPALGIRGIRLAHLRPTLYRAQVTALALAAAQCGRLGRPDDLADPAGSGNPVPRVLVPMIATAAEFAAGVRLVKSAWAAAVPSSPSPPIGAMIETPRAALIAGQLAEQADFLCIGSNDLSQFTFGFSRDDLDTRLLAPYTKAGLLDANPFVTLDGEGVGELIAIACERARAVKPDLSITLCGEHSADVASLAIAHKLGIRAVSCAPHSLAAAQSAAAKLAQAHADK